MVEWQFGKDEGSAAEKLMVLEAQGWEGGMPPLVSLVEFSAAGACPLPNPEMMLLQSFSVRTAGRVLTILKMILLPPAQYTWRCCTFSLVASEKRGST